jgi:hypothetical protein
MGQNNYSGEEHDAFEALYKGGADAYDIYNGYPGEKVTWTFWEKVKRIFRRLMASRRT